MSEEEYIRERLDEQTQWFRRKSAENQKKYKRYRKAQSICILLVPVLSLFPCFSVRIAAALCGLLAAGSVSRAMALLSPRLRTIETRKAPIPNWHRSLRR